MSLIDIKNRREELEVELKKLKKEEEELKCISPDRVAIFLHEKTCTLNHTDMCAWGWEDWTGPTHQEYANRASCLLQHFTEDQIYLFVELMKKY